MSSWFEFNLNINNILVALTARKFKWDIAPADCGRYGSVRGFAYFQCPRFRLSGEVDYLDQLVKISETEELVEREKKLDQLAVELDGGCYFLRLFHCGTSVRFPAEAGND